MRLRRRHLAPALAAVLLSLPTFVYALCAPSVSGIFPASGIVGTNVTAVVRGEGLGNATVGVFGDPGLMITTQSNNDIALSLQIVVAPDAPLGERILVIETPGGIAGASFTVNAVGGIVVADVTPQPIATRGFGLDLMVSGSALNRLVPMDVTVSGSGVSVVSSVPTGDGSMLDLSLAVAADAELGARAIEISSSSAGGAILQMVVQRPGPALTPVSPGAGEVGATVPITITGTNLTGAALVMTGSGVAVKVPRTVVGTGNAMGIATGSGVSVVGALPLIASGTGRTMGMATASGVATNAP